MQPTTTVEYEVFRRAHINWLAYTGRKAVIYNDLFYHRFMKIDVRSIKWFKQGGLQSDNLVVVPPEAKYKMEMLAGPHWYAMMKALEAQGGEDAERIKEAKA